MKSRWDILKSIKERQPGEIEASCFVSADSPWFEGHFPGEPILPGIALVHVVRQAILRNAQERHEQIKLGELKKIRFVQPVRPNETLQLRITRDETQDKIIFSFKVASGENIVSSGMMIGEKMN